MPSGSRTCSRRFVPPIQEGGCWSSRYNTAAPVTEAARAFRIELLYLPPYSPNLNLIERFWKYRKGKVVRNR